MLYAFELKVDNHDELYGNTTAPAYSVNNRENHSR